MPSHRYFELVRSRNPPDSELIEFTLVENGLDFVVKALGELRGDPDPRNLKYAVLHLKAGTDLLLKERLRIHDWRQLFVEVGEADEQRFARGDFKSPGTPLLLTRLRDEAGVVVAARHKRTLWRLRALRNRIEHFAVRDEASAVLAVAAKTLSFALDFVGAEIEPQGVEGRAAEDLETIRQGLNGVVAFVDERWRAIRDELARADAVIDCYRCGEEAFILGDGGRCLFCGFRVEAETGAAEYAWLVLGSTEYDVTKGGDWAVSRCSECYAETLVDTGNVGGEAPATRWVCFSCGQAWKEDELDNCTSCGALHQSEMDICSDCWEYKTSGD
jgi:ribosomal protein L37E